MKPECAILELAFGAVQKCANLALVELEKCCQTHISLQNLVSIQPRTSPPKFCKIIILIYFVNFFSPAKPISSKVTKKQAHAASQAADKGRNAAAAAGVVARHTKRREFLLSSAESDLPPGAQSLSHFSLRSPCASSYPETSSRKHLALKKGVGEISAKFANI